MSESYQCFECGRWVLPGQADHDDCPLPTQRENWEEWKAVQVMEAQSDWLRIKLAEAIGLDLSDQTQNQRTDK